MPDIELPDFTPPKEYLPPLLLSTKDAAAVCGTSIRTWRGWDAGGKIPQPIRIGRATFWRLKDLQEWTEAGCPDRETWEAFR